MLKFITLIVGICFLIDAKSMEKESSSADDSFKVFEQQGFTKDAQGHISAPPYPKIELPSKEDEQASYRQEKIAKYLLERYPELIHRNRMLENNRNSFINCDYVQKGNSFDWIPLPNFLKEAPDVCSSEEPFPPSIQRTFDYRFQPPLFINLTEILIKEKKEELYSLNKEAIKNYTYQLEILACLGDNDFGVGKPQSFIKYLIWNRILLVREAFQQLFHDKFIPNLNQYSLENLQILTAHTQLSRITKDHIDHLWIDHDVFPNVFLYPYPKIRPWQDQKERRSFKFAELLKKIFNPIAYGQLPTNAEFNKIFEALITPYPGEQ